MTIGPGQGFPGGGRARMRASTADRDHVVDLLNNAYAEGRLTKDEFDGRMATALTAPTYGDLDRVLYDLPGTRPAAGRTNQMAIASLCCGAGQVVAGPLTTIPAIVCGHIARGQIRRTGEEGGGLALAGLLMGYAGAALIVLALLVIVLIFP
jgi:Domain of unknown function (DUF1707)/Domain of unknown function (DUF4190)